MTAVSGQRGGDGSLERVQPSARCCVDTSSARMATTLEMSMFDGHVTAAPPPSLASLVFTPPRPPPPRPLPSTFCPHMSRSGVSRWPDVLGDGGVTASRLPQNVEHCCARIRWKLSVSVLCFFSPPPPPGVDRQSRKRIHLKAWDMTIRSEMLWSPVWRHNLLLPVSQLVP